MGVNGGGCCSLMVMLVFAVFISVCSAGRHSSISRNKLQLQRHLNRLNKPSQKTILSPDGDVIECVHISRQPAFDHPFLKNHTIQMRPNYHPEGLYDDSKVASKSKPKEKRQTVSQLWHHSGEKCPEGTIPVRRTKEEDVLRAESIKTYGRKKHRSIAKPRSPDPDLVNESGHQHAIAYVEGDKYYGAKATINVWEPRIQQPNEFSLSQIWVLGGSFGQDLNSIEAGWQVSPDLYGDNNTRLFTYWTSDAYQATGCYNLLCSGFIQINSEIAMGASISPVSGYRGSQYDISILVWKMADGDERRNKLHASARRKITFKMGSTSFGSREVSMPSETDFYEGGEFEQFQKELADEMRNYEGSENEEEEDEEVGNEVMENEVMDNEVPGNQEAGNVEAGNVEATSGLRVRRGIHGRFEVYGEGSSTSIPEPRRKVRARGKDTSWILRGPAPGGPVVPKLIPSFGGHISYLLWSQPQLQRLLTKYTRERSLAELRSWKLSAAAWKIVEDSGISHLPNIMHKHLNMPLLCAFIERWQPDTNTFHMPWGEMTILLHDVQEILGIEIDGFPCSIPDADMAHPILGVSELLGMTEAELGSQWGPDKDAKIYKGNLILQKALKDLVEGDKRGKASEAQGYLMLLLSSTLFVDKSSDRVRANTFPMLRDVGSISGIAWGAGTLAYLYRQMGIATRSDCKGLCGCLTLLQSWIFEYFPAFRPMATLTAPPGAPRAMLWSTTAVPQREAGRALVSYREQLDMMPIETVAWRPYPDHPETEHPRSVYHGLLRFIDIVEPYQPDRCLRQFGYMQNIPTPMVQPDKVYRPVKSISYDVQYDGAFLDYTWNNWKMHMTHLDRVSMPAHPPHSYAVGYMEWFVSHSHPYVMNVPRDADQVPLARSHFPTTVGHSLIQTFSHYDNVEDPAVTAEVRNFLRNVHPQMRAYTGRPPVVEGSRGRGRRSRGRGRGRDEEEVESGRGRGRGRDDDQRWSRSEPTTSRRTY